MFGSSANDQPDAPVGVGTKLIFTLFGLVFMGAGLLFLWFIGGWAIQGIQTWTWRKTACEVTASSVGQQNQAGEQAGDFTFQVEYHYSFGGHEFVSDRYDLQTNSFEDYGKAAGLADRYRSGSHAFCYVNPAAPAQAVLVRGNLLRPLFMLCLASFPMIFVLIGGAEIYKAWLGKSASQLAALPISDQALPARRAYIPLILFLICMVGFGSAVSWIFLGPAYKILSASAWPAVPCVVISSEVKSHSGDGTTYRVNILYSYEFKGRAFKSNTYDFMVGSTGDYEAQQAVVARHPPGTKTVCYVNPDELTEAVLERGFTSNMWSCLIPLVFVLLGAWVLAAILRHRPKSAPVGGATARSGAFGVGAAASGPVFSASGVAERLVLKPPFSRWGMFFGAVVLCLFWNGIISMLVIQAVDRWDAGNRAWGMMLFLIPFVAIGLVFVGFVLYQFLVLFNPRPHLAVTPGAVPLGGTLQVEWKLTGRVGVLQNLHLRLEGREDARFGGSRGSSEAKRVFAKLEIADVTTPREMRSGEARVTIPARLVPSFAGRNNKIIWAILVHGKIARWPDVKEEFPVTVLPSAPTSRPSL